VREVASTGGFGRQVVDEDGKPPDGKLAPVELREVDAVVTLKVSLYGVDSLAE
jgi:hypothetical protein